MNFNRTDDTTLQSDNQDYRFATVVERTGTHVKVRFDGEDEASEIEYPILSETYIPNANYATGDRVLMLRAAGTYIIMGKLRSVYVPEEIEFHEDFSMWPGPKYIINGNTEKGYFGRIPQNEFISYEGLCDELGLRIGEVPAYPVDSPEWLKIIYKGQVKYIPSLPIRIKPYRYKTEYDEYDGKKRLTVKFFSSDDASDFCQQAQDFFSSKRIVTVSGFKMMVDLITTNTTSPIDNNGVLDPNLLIKHPDIWHEFITSIFYVWDTELSRRTDILMKTEQYYLSHPNINGREVRLFYGSEGGNLWFREGPKPYVLGKELIVGDVENLFSAVNLKNPYEKPVTLEKVGRISLMVVLTPYKEEGKEGN